MLLNPLRWVNTAALLILVYLTQGTHTTVISLLDLMPKCASACIESFISTEYPRHACAKGCDIDLLCTTNTTSGYTLGEAALRCGLSMCSMEVALSFDTYSICDSIPGALPRTHATIVATLMSVINPTSTTTAPTTILTTEIETSETRPTPDPTPTRTDHTSSTLMTFQSPVSVTESAQGSSSSTDTEHPTFTETSDSSPSATSSETPNTSSGNGGLNPGAVIGVSVASGVSGFFIFGVIIFLCCKKARRKKAKDQEFFEIGGHMSEPPGFRFPPIHPPMGPRPSPRTFNTDSESVRLVPPVETDYQHPTVIVTEPQNEYDYNHMTGDRASSDRTGFQSTSNLEFDAASTVSSRTVSDLLPDKPTYDLYPRPLRWSQYKKSRPSSGATLFEENLAGPRHPPSSSPRQFQSATGKGHNRPPMGLPANPRAMLYGFGRGQNHLPPAKGPEHRKNPVYANAKEKNQPGQAAILANSPYMSGHMDYGNDFDNYWPSSDAGFAGAKVVQPHSAARRSTHGAESNRISFGDNPDYEFESADINDNPNSDPRRASRHSGSFRPLTPVREIRTPTGEVERTIGENPSHHENKPVRYPPGPSSGPLNQPQAIVSRPRIVRQDDIKRVQIRRGKPSPKEVTVPYSPDDYWLGQGQETSSWYNSPRHSGDYRPTSGGMIGRMPKKKPSPLGNLTTSRRGADMILQVS